MTNDFNEEYRTFKSKYSEKLEKGGANVERLNEIFEQRVDHKKFAKLAELTGDINKRCGLTRARFRTKCFELYVFKCLKTFYKNLDIKYEEYLYFDRRNKKERLKPDFMLDGGRIIIECKSELDQEIWEVAARSLIYKKHFGVEKVYVVTWNRHRKMIELEDTLKECFGEYFLDGIFNLTNKEDFEKFKNEIKN